MKHLLVFLLLLCAASVSAQDVIIKKDGSTIVCRVVELTSTEIVYKKWSDLNGSNYVMDRSLASAINYENGKKVSLSEATNLYQPNNQNDGTQQYNDRALLGIDYNINKKYNRTKNIAWIGGGALMGIAIFFTLDQVLEGDDWGQGLIALPCFVASVSWTTSFLLAARHAKKANMLQSSSILQRNLNFSNGSSLSLGADLLRDNTLGQNTLGLGLRYNF